MEYRKLPHGEERLGVLGLGMGGIQNCSDDEIEQVVRSAIDHGINFFDLCAGGENVYQPFGRAIAGQRDKVLFQLHLGAVYNEKGEYGWSRDMTRMRETFEGEHFYKKSIILVADYDRLVQDTARIARGNQSELRIGYLKSCSSQIIQRVVVVFSERYPDVTVHILSGSHEDLYHALRTGKADIVLNDQRRAFSDEYVNCSLVYRDCYAEIAARNPIAALESVSPEDLKNTPCILIASKGQQRTEQTYYREVFGFQGDFLFADNLDEARMMVVQNNGFMPTDDGVEHLGDTTVRLPLLRGDRPIRQHYCAFWKADNPECYAEKFAELLKEELTKTGE